MLSSTLLQARPRTGMGTPPCPGPAAPWVCSCHGKLNKSHAARSQACLSPGRTMGVQDVGEEEGSVLETPVRLGLSWAALTPHLTLGGYLLESHSAGSSQHWDPLVGPHPQIARLGACQGTPCGLPLEVPDSHASTSLHPTPSSFPISSMAARIVRAISASPFL